MNFLLFRAILAFLALPGTIAFLVPLWIARAGGPVAKFHPGSVPILAAGVVLLLWCVRDFYVAGRGTLAPWSPPRHLVRVGLYRFSRNPMYVAVGVILAGWAAGFGSLPLAVYGGAVLVLFHLRVVLHEEPALARAFGAEWERYRAEVPRWVGPSRP